MLFFKKKSAIEKYQEAKAAFDIQEDIIGRFSSVSDVQVDKYAKLKTKMLKAKSEVFDPDEDNIVHLKTKESS